MFPCASARVKEMEGALYLRARLSEVACVCVCPHLPRGPCPSNGLLLIALIQVRNIGFNDV